jgi:hypothetical protein
MQVSAPLCGEHQRVLVRQFRLGSPAAGATGRRDNLAVTGLQFRGDETFDVGDRGVVAAEVLDAALAVAAELADQTVTTEPVRSIRQNLLEPPPTYRSSRTRATL